jgi:hypothetical protein
MSEMKVKAHEKAKDLRQAEGKDPRLNVMTLQLNNMVASFTLRLC